MFTAYPVFSIFSSAVSEYIYIQLCTKTREFRVGRLGQSRFRVTNSEKRGGILFAADSPSYHRWHWNEAMGEFHEPSNHSDTPEGLFCAERLKFLFRDQCREVSEDIRPGQMEIIKCLLRNTIFRNLHSNCQS
jgi:hypothetical protein